MSSAPFVLEEDRKVLESRRKRQVDRYFGSWNEACADPDFCRPAGTQTFGLTPNAVHGGFPARLDYVLLLNPGLGSHNYIGEVMQYRSALQSVQSETTIRRSVTFSVP